MLDSRYDDNLGNWGPKKTDPDQFSGKRRMWVKFGSNLGPLFPENGHLPGSRSRQGRSSLREAEKGQIWPFFQVAERRKRFGGNRDQAIFRPGALEN